MFFAPDDESPTGYLNDWILKIGMAKCSKDLILDEVLGFADLSTLAIQRLKRRIIVDPVSHEIPHMLGINRCCCDSGGQIRSSRLCGHFSTVFGFSSDYSSASASASASATPHIKYNNSKCK